MTTRQRQRLAEVFDLPDLGNMDDSIATACTAAAGRGLSAGAVHRPGVDYSLHRLRHYTGTSPEHFQNFILFTNYQFYIDEFIAPASSRCRTRAVPTAASCSPATSSRTAPACPRCLREQGTGAPRGPQMPAYHLKRDDRSGITLSTSASAPATPRPSPTTSPRCARTPGSWSATAPACATASSWATTCWRMGTWRGPRA